MNQRSPEATHIIWSMLFVAGALGLSYMLALGRGRFLVWPIGGDDAIASGVVGQQDMQVKQENEEGKGLVKGDVFLEKQEWVGGDRQASLDSSVTSLSQALSTTNPQNIVTEPIISLSEALVQVDDTVIGRSTQITFETPDPVEAGGKQFFSVQQLFDRNDDIDELVEQRTLALDETYERTNNGRFVLPEAVWVADYVQYILKDQYNTHYVYLGDHVPVSLDGVLTNGWSVVAIEDKLGINRSWFFGDALWLISLPEYEARQKIIALVVFGSAKDTWLFQIDRNHFENGGSDMLQTSFGRFYTR